MFKVLSSLLIVVACLFAMPGTSAAETNSVQFDSIKVFPTEISLFGLRDKQQLLVAAAVENGKESADLTAKATFESTDPAIALVTNSGIVIPRGEGTTQVVIRMERFTQTVDVLVTGIGEPERIDFTTEVVAALSRAGCNQGACHGSPQGKNGFRISLRGFDPSLDLESLVRDQFNRRINPFQPDESLILKKGLNEVPHQGGTRFQKNEAAYQVLRTWIYQGANESTQPKQLVKLEVLPGRRRLAEAYPRQQLISIAHFDDGTVRDVTDLTVFSSNDEVTATVSPEGHVEFHQTGEVAFLARYLDKVTGVRLTWVQRDRAFVFKSPAAANFIDELIFAKQRELQIQTAALADDSRFLRRVYLDVIGALPTVEEATRFLDSTAADKRSLLIEELLDRDEFAYFWALKWADILQGSDVTISRRGVFSLHRYLVNHFREDRPFDQFARELLTGLGNTLHHPGANFFRVSRTPDVMAENMSQLFLGVRIGCAKCHNHPFESITQNDYYGFAAYFSRVKFKGKQFGLDDEIVYLDQRTEVRHPITNINVAPSAFGEQIRELGPDGDRREELVNWLTSSENPYFARSIVNRLWYHLFGMGIVDPVDDFRETNPPSNPELLDRLAAEFVESGFRIRPVLRNILNSSTYQLESQPAKQSAFAADRERYFAHARVQMLMGEQILDAISQATGIASRFEGYPEGTKAIELAEGTIDHPFLQAFAKPVRDSNCECARDSDPSISQVIHLLNNPEIVGGLTSPQSKISAWMQAGKSDSVMIDLIYLSAVSRRATEAEQRLMADYLQGIESRADGFADLQHALLNSNEFLLRH